MSEEVKLMLQAAKALIEKPGTWCQGVMAQTSDGDEVYYAGPLAAKFCMLGALSRVTTQQDTQLSPIYRKSLEALYLATGTNPHQLDEWNDFPSRTHEDVIAAFDKAIKGNE